MRLASLLLPHGRVCDGRQTRPEPARSRFFTFFGSQRVALTRQRAFERAAGGRTCRRTGGVVLTRRIRNLATNSRIRRTEHRNRLGGGPFSGVKIGAVISPRVGVRYPRIGWKRPSMVPTDAECLDRS